MLCDMEKEQLEELLSTYSKHSFKIVLLPHIKDIDEVLKSGKTSWRAFEKVLPLYVHLRKQTIDYIGSLTL